MTELTFSQRAIAEFNRRDLEEIKRMNWSISPDNPKNWSPAQYAAHQRSELVNKYGLGALRAYNAVFTK